MNDRTPFERQVADRIAEEPRSIPLPDAFVTGFTAQAERTGQRPRWLALLKESPMRTNSRTVVGSPTARVAAVMAATLLLAVALAAAGVAGQRLLAAGPIVVAQDGSGTYTTITEAVDAAASGDRIEVRPGTYVENVIVIGKDLEIVGDGDRDAIVVEVSLAGPNSAFDWTAYLAPDDPPQEEALDPPDAHAMILADTNSTVSNLTFLGQAQAIAVVGPDANVDFSGIKTLALEEPRGSTGAVQWERGSSGSLSDSHIEGWVGVWDGATVVIEQNEMPATCVVFWGVGADVTIRDNTIHGCEYEKGLEIDGSNTALIEGNTIWVEEADPGPPDPLWGGREAIAISGAGDGTITIRDNDLRESLIGVRVDAEEATVEISGNRITDNETGLQVGFGADLAFTGNTLCGNADDYALAIGMDEEAFVAANEVCAEDG